ncbi:dihydroneopterin aldolase [Micrococcaceae sp. AOP34-BR2-30]
MIRLTGLRARGYHGVLERERAEGQTFLVDVELELVDGQLDTAARTDDVADTVNYAEVAETALGILTGEPARLIETVAARIADAVLETQPLVHRVLVTVHKPEAPISADFADVAVVVARER